MPLADFDTIRGDLDFLDDWEDRYRYIIDLGRTLSPLAEDERSDANKVRGCASQVWLVTERRSEDDGTERLEFRGDSDAHIVRGLVALTLSLFSGRRPDEILTIDAPAVFASIGLREHLTPQRSNGLAAMVERIRGDARRAIGQG